MRRFDPDPRLHQINTLELKSSAIETWPRDFCGEFLTHPLFSASLCHDRRTLEGLNVLGSRRVAQFAPSRQFDDPGWGAWSFAVRYQIDS